jgi:hypothetical protein
MTEFWRFSSHVNSSLLVAPTKGRLIDKCVENCQHRYYPQHALAAAPPDWMLVMTKEEGRFVELENPKDGYLASSCFCEAISNCLVLTTGVCQSMGHQESDMGHHISFFGSLGKAYGCS